MAYVLAVTWIAKPGNEASVYEILQQMGDASRQEAGVVTYTTHVDPDNPREFFIYEKYHGLVGLSSTRRPRTSRNWFWKRQFRCWSPECAGNTLSFSRRGRVASRNRPEDGRI